MAVPEKSWLDKFSLLKDDFKLYWRIFGGWTDIKNSAYICIAIILALLSYRLFSKDWYDLSISIIPNVLGFTLGGYAVMLTFGGEKFIKIISLRLPKDEGKPTPYMCVNGAFVHFIVVQIITLLYSLVAKSMELKGVIFGFLGEFLLYYTILTALAAVFAIMNLADWYEEILNLPELKTRVKVKSKTIGRVRRRRIR